MSFLFVDRITDLSPGEFARGLKHVTQDDLYLDADPQGRACFLSSLIGETLGQLAAWNVMSHNRFSLRPVAGVVASAILHRPVYVGETIALEAHIDSLDDRAVLYHGQATVQGEPVFTLDGALGPLLPMTDFIALETVKQQFQQVYRPFETAQTHAESIFEPMPFPAQAAMLKLPKLGYDHLLQHTQGVELLAEKRISRAAPWFPDHFPNRPVLPMTILLECKLNLARWFVSQAGFATNYQIRELRKVKMNEFVQPGDVIRTQLKVKAQDEQQLILSFRSEVDGQRVCVLEMLLQA